MKDASRWIILSPHLDDGMLSLGGIARALSRAHDVEVWTVFANAPFRGPYSHVARWLHDVSGGKTGIRLIRQRRAEDRAACTELGVRCRHLKWMDAAYRRTPSGTPLYRNCRINALSFHDRALVADVAGYLRRELRPSDILLAPLALGGHVDHLVAREAAQSCGHRRIMYYPEIPYIVRRADRLEQASDGMDVISYDLAGGDVDAWVSAIRHYATQFAMFDEASGGVVELIRRMSSTGNLKLLTKDAVRLEAELPVPPFRPVTLGNRWPRRVTPPFATAFRDEGVTPVPDWADDELAPVAVFAFRRLGLLKKTLAALERCDGFESSRIHLFCDGPPQGDATAAAAVAKLREWALAWCTSRGARLHESQANRGLRTSIVSGVTELLSAHENVIVLEDDIIVSPAFLVFMNQALQAYRDRDDVMQVAGWFVPHRRRLEPVGLLRSPASWGWATWRRAWQHYSDDAHALLDRVRRKDAKAFDFNGSYAYLDALERNAAGALDTWAVRWYASIFLRDGLVLHPRTSFTRNIGFGDDGTNCEPGPVGRVLARQRIQQRRVSPRWESVGTVESREYAEVLENFYRWQNSIWTRPTLGERVRQALGRLNLAGSA